MNEEEQSKNERRPGDANALEQREMPEGLSDLTADERNDLLALEAVIEAGQETFVQVGAALLAIRDHRLYRETHKTFEAYVKARWSCSRARAYQLMDWAGVARNLSTDVDMRGLNEAQARAIASLPADDQRVVYRFAMSMAPKGRPTASFLKDLAEVTRGVMQTGAIDDGTGAKVAWDELAHERKAVAIQTAVDQAGYDRWKRNHDHVVRVAMSSGSYEWYTPRIYVESARTVLEEIELDPASSDKANQTVRAATYYSVDDDGLQHEWEGRVWMNPPYSSLASRFVAHLLREYKVGRTTAAVVLLNAHNTDCQWFQPLWDYPCCFTNHRIAFVSGNDDQAHSGNNHGSVFFYLGSDVGRFVEVFTQFGPIVGRIDR